MINSAYSARAAADRQRHLRDAAAEHRLAKLSGKANAVGPMSCEQAGRASWSLRSAWARIPAALTRRRPAPAPVAGELATELVIDLVPVVELPVVTAELAVASFD